jgi:hypothetical protein
MTEEIVSVADERIHDENQNVTLITGFSIKVFEAVVKCLQYPLIYDMVPFHGS